jgi:hypothetical protein
MILRNILPFILTGLFVIAAGILAAQPLGGGSPPPGGTPECWPPPCIPIDGGVMFLLAAGLAFGGKTLLGKKK